MKAIADVNRASGRSQALQLELTIRVGDEPAVDSGELISHSSGLARLEVRGKEGRIDRYLLLGDELLGSTDGRVLSQPRPLLQPFFLLQLASEVTLRAALESFGIESDWIGLAPCGDQDCFVLGDRRLGAPWPLPAPLPESGVLGDPLSDPDGLEGEGSDLEPGLAGFLELGVGTVPEQDDARDEAEDDSQDGGAMNQRLPRLWVDTQGLQVRRIDRADGVYVVFGPVASFDRLRVPAWFEVHLLGEALPIRFEVERAVRVNAPPKAFSRGWLALPAAANGSQEPD